MNLRKFYIIFSIFVLGFLDFLSAQNDTFRVNVYGLKVIDDYEVYNDVVTRDSSKKLVDVESVIPNIKLDIRYATTNNFVGEIMYSKPKAYLVKSAAVALYFVQSHLAASGLGLKIYDAYRPYSVTLKFWEKIKDTNFVAPPWRGSKHNRGTAVDLTLIDLKTGEELKMPTEYDEFTEKAYPYYEDLPSDVIENRNFLINIMAAYGFYVEPTEWWHFNYKSWAEYELLDIPFEKLEN
ncbi:MAG: M15 family metallopeptidase [Ignavibacteria bacterium]|nr:M15 family metallopeptidase [Ignavibacteria bacterium]